MTHPLLVLVLAIVVVVGLIMVLRANAFIALIISAILVSFLAPGPWEGKMQRVADAFGAATAKIGIVIALAAVIGKCLMDSGAADRIVRSFLKLLGEKRAPEALAGASFVLGMPVFFDTVFYLMVPLARSLYKQTRKNYLLYILAIGTGGAVTHTMVPPTPGPLAVAANLNIDLGVMILGGTLLAAPTALVGLLTARVFNRLMPVPMRPYAGEPDATALPDQALPPLWLSILPIVLPVILISGATVARVLVGDTPSTLSGMVDARHLVAILGLVGNPNLALLLSALIAMGMLVRQRRLSLNQLAQAVEESLLSGGVIILITAAGGALGAMLAEAKVGEGVQGLFGFQSGQGRILIVIAFGIAALLKIAQGSSTVAMLTTSAMVAAMAGSPDRLPALLGCHPVYLAVGTAAGSLVGSWMNDSGFWIVARMSVLTEAEALKSWTIQLVIVAFAALGFALLGAYLVPLG